MVSRVVSLKHFARYIYNIQKNDFDVLGVVSGFTGIGKSTFSIMLQTEHSKVSGLDWDLSHLTWSRGELLNWINGEGNNKEGQLPDYSAIISDELFMMFYKRNWFNTEQQEALGVLKSCRDRHLFILGNIPNFWELDKNFSNQVGFYIYIPKRGEALIFQQENNAFSDDTWNRRINMKLFASGDIEKSINFLFKVYFNDLSSELKAEYLSLRNRKRVSDMLSNKIVALESYKTIKLREAYLIQEVFRLWDSLGRKHINKDLSIPLGTSVEYVRRQKEVVLPTKL